MEREIENGRKRALNAETILQADLNAVTKYVTDYVNAGGSPDTLRLVPADQILQATRWQNVNPDWKIRFATADDARANPFTPGEVAAGNAGLRPTAASGKWFDPANKALWIDPTKRAPGFTITHENFRPIFDSLVSLHPDIKATLDAALAQDGRSIDEFERQYAEKTHRNDPQGAADYIVQMDAVDPDWAYPELLAESAAHELQGKDLLQAMQGKTVQQSATQAALGGVEGWLSDQGVRVQKGVSGTVFPDFQNVFSDPNVRKLIYQLLKAKRALLLGEAPTALKQK